MPMMLLTCPESAHLEEVELELSPLGILIKHCSGESCGTCPRTCAGRLDRRGRVGALLLARSCLRE